MDDTDHALFPRFSAELVATALKDTPVVMVRTRHAPLSSKGVTPGGSTGVGDYGHGRLAHGGDVPPLRQR
jgi:hypothetical protein